MDESFLISIGMHGNEYSFEARLVTYGYTHRFMVLINGIEVNYEPDEERNYRAIIGDTSNSKIRDIDRELIKAVGEKIQSID